MTTTCKHRWEPITYFKSLAPNRYAYHCKRCSGIIFAVLKERQNATA